MEFMIPEDRRIISENNYRDIQSLAKAFDDTLDSKLSEIIEFFKFHASKTLHAVSLAPSGPPGQSFNAFVSPDLRHTKLTFASVRSRVPRAPNWNSLLYEVVTQAAKVLGDFETLEALTSANISKGRKTTGGYHYLATVGLSVQGQSANDAWRAIANLSLATGLRVEAKFHWRQKQGAFRPGEAGEFLIEGAP
jgi:hypothetical protein